MDATTPTKPIEHDWADFIRARDAYHAARSKMLISLLPWLESVVTKAMRRLPARASRDEVKSEAVVVLFDLFDRYDPARGPFVVFAKPRVVGAIGDWIRRKRLTSREFSLSDLLADCDT